MSYSKDCELGDASESKNLSVLSKLMGKLERLPKYHTFDYQGQNILIELKTRTNSYKKHDTTLIPKNKVDACTDPDTRYIFAFQFTDGLYKIEYNKELFSKFNKVKFVRNTRTGWIDIPKDYVLIPIEELQRIN